MNPRLFKIKKIITIIHDIPHHHRIRFSMRLAFLSTLTPVRTHNPTKMLLSPQTPSPPHPPLSNLFLSASKALEIDKALMSEPYHHTLEQLMELAGLAVAHAVADLQPPSPVCIICGPGNNGGDGLVAARHLKHFAYSPTIIYPKKVHKYPFEGLLHQVGMLDIPLVEQIPGDTQLIVDAVFGFSFKGEHGVRQPFDKVIDGMNTSGKPVLSVDIPSGWHVDKGPVWECCVKEPAAVVSLTAPKMCMKEFNGVHYVGGRFVPPRLCWELEFAVPEYSGTNAIVRIT